ncbi:MULTISPECIES: ABC transporter ATP-binding protein [unclassified Granulicatella]|uniref:ABC transporter ATP-binding protein n=1 Tax=unclassified Granulicatella TaxID=2630493 RepID=UPI00107460BF|nr:MULTISPECIES: ABC transporter ATP-binding protein [unclassified Granulicatella]MBF0779804.1 ABC transporter ATP-binding protein [Granulicatella sp. 19428wC4_WM01]TFU96106.1 ABC transporter ATP-binding protein [Granulicatella sp. WM01]
MISVQQASKKIGNKEILKPMTFTIQEGECVALIGQNGAGKTTLLECLIGDRALNSGYINIKGINEKTNHLRKDIAMLLQEQTALESIKVGEFIRFFQQIYQDCLTTEEIDHLLKFSVEQKNQYMTKLSGGQFRLLSFVVTLIGKPKVLLLDEPTAFMDTSTRYHFWEIINLLKQQGVTIIYSSHYIEEVEHTADRILVLHKGELLEDTTPYALRHQKCEKHFTIPAKYKSSLEQIEQVSSIKEKHDNIELMTKNPQIVWDKLMEANCPIEDIEMTNKTLLNILFEQSGGKEEHEGTI